MDDGFDEWYRRERPRVERIVLVACGGDPDVAADASDEAMVRAYERWRRVRAMDNPHGWVTAVALNVARRKFRRRSHERRVLDVASRTETDVAADPDVDGSVTLWRAIAALPRRSREVIALRYVDGLTEDQVAASLGIAVGTVSSILSRARRELRRELEPHESDQLSS